MKKQHKPSDDGLNTEQQPQAQATVDEPDQAPADDAQAAETDDLQRQLQDARDESARNFDGWQRAMAEFQNYRRRTEREMKESYQNAVGDVLVSLLPIIDDYERALANVPDHIRQDAWYDGVGLIQRKLLKMLDDYQVSALNPAGEMFDPNRHQALGADADTDVESGHVSEVLQKGYAMGDRVLRPALVKVAQ